MTNKIIEAARECGLTEGLELPHEIESVVRFYAIARAEALEDAAKVCDEQQTEGECPERASYCAEAIRALMKKDAAIAAGKGEG